MTIAKTAKRSSRSECNCNQMDKVVLVPRQSQQEFPRMPRQCVSSGHTETIEVPPVNYGGAKVILKHKLKNSQAAPPHPTICRSGEISKAVLLPKDFKEKEWAYLKPKTRGRPDAEPPMEHYTNKIGISQKPKSDTKQSYMKNLISQLQPTETTSSASLGDAEISNLSEVPKTIPVPKAKDLSKYAMETNPITNVTDLMISDTMTTNPVPKAANYSSTDALKITPISQDTQISKPRYSGRFSPRNRPVPKPRSITSATKPVPKPRSHINTSLLTITQIQKDCLSPKPVKKPLTIRSTSPGLLEYKEGTVSLSKAKPKPIKSLPSSSVCKSLPENTKTAPKGKSSPIPVSLEISPQAASSQSTLFKRFKSTVSSGVGNLFRFHSPPLQKS